MWPVPPAFWWADWAGATWRQLWGILPYALAGLAACLLLPSRLNLLMLGDEVAESLGAAHRGL
jgi:ABC-type Fe3+-siderophore transport system permease subunit